MKQLEAIDLMMATRRMLNSGQGWEDLSEDQLNLIEWIQNGHD